jgi:O-methyltransferase involved in polyketide biosynthesis
MTSEVVNFAEEKETLLITLYAKAEESKLPDTLLKDHFAAEVIRHIQYPFGKLKLGSFGIIGLTFRAKLLEEWCIRFIDEHPDATALHLGCGLDSRAFRLNPPSSIKWFDVDYPEIADLRRRLYPERDGCTIIGTSVTHPGWLHDIPQDRSALIVAEGLLPYLMPEEVSQLLTVLSNHFRNGEIIFDGYSRLGLRILSKLPSIRATGAKFRWSINDPKEIEAQVPSLKFTEQRTGYDATQIARLASPARQIVQLMQMIPASRGLGRVLRYRF